MKKKNELNELKPPLEISSEEEFLLLIEGFDQEISRENIKISARPFALIRKFTSRYNIILNGLPPRRPPKHGCFDPLEISIRIHDWVKKRYGEKLNIPFQIGKIAIPLRGDLYLINCPHIWGEVDFFCDPMTIGQKREAIGLDAPPTANILDLLENLTPDLAQSLSFEEFVKINVSFLLGLGAYLSFEVIKNVSYIREAKGDLDASVFHLMGHQPQMGLSKWASLQAVEKVIKAYISLKGETIPQTHELGKLCTQAERLGIPRPHKKFLDILQCPAKVRYGEISVSIEEAVKAHHVSLEICEYIARYIGIELKCEMPIIPELQVNGIPLSQFLQKIDATP